VDVPEVPNVHNPLSAIPYQCRTRGDSNSALSKLLQPGGKFPRVQISSGVNRQLDKRLEFCLKTDDFFALRVKAMVRAARHP
jgi:hypothetical protein